MTMLTQEEKTYMLDYLKDTQAKLVDFCKKTSAAQAIFQPSEDVWSIANNVEHLALVEKSLRAAITFSLSQTPSEEEIASHTNSNNYVRKAVSTRGVALKAPERVAPSLTMNIEESLAIFLERREDNMNFLTTTEEDLHKHYWKHPFLGLFDTYQIFMMLAAHTERHIAQMEEVMANENFPK